MKRLTFVSALAGLLAIVLVLPVMAATVTTPAATDFLPASYFAKYPKIRSVTLSPDGKHLAGVLTIDQSRGTEAQFQLVVFDLPSLKVASRLKFRKNLLPLGVTWVSNTRLVMSEGVYTGSLDFPQSDGNILALNYDGTNQRTLYSVRNWGDPGSSFNMTSMVHGSPSVVGPTDEMNGHVFISIMPYPQYEGTRNSAFHQTLLYDVNTQNDYPRQVAKINHGRMEFLVYHDTAVFAYGTNSKNMPVVFSRSNGQEAWRQMASSQVGVVFGPFRVAPDGKHVFAYYSAKGGPEELVETNFNGQHRQVLASNPFGSVNSFWSTPNDHVPFAVTFAGVYAHGKPVITYLLDNRYSQIMKALNQQFGDHFVSLSGISKNGDTILIHAVSATDPGEYALLNAKTMQLKPLLQVEPWIKPARMGPRVAFRFHNRDGLLLDGYLTFPVGVPHKNLPTVVLVHGGPIGPRDQWYYGSLQLAPFLANRGYAVINVNYRGSGGRGLNFQKLGWRQFGTGIQNDIVDGVRWAIRKGYVNPKRICVFGASFGGYSSLMQPIVAPKLYKCAIDYSGVSDWTIEMNRSVYARSAAGNVSYQQFIGTDADAKAISPLYMLKRFNVPVLIAQGGADNIVPPQNAERLRDALQAAHKPYEWLFYPGEYHGFQIEPHRLVLLHKMSAFLRKYLGPGVTQARPSIKTAIPASS